MSRQGAARRPTIENIKDFWNKEATEWGDSPRVTIRDHYMRLLEVQIICDLIKGRKNVYDIGCGTGFSTLFYSQHVDKIIGADFAEHMIGWANKLLEDKAYFEKTMGEYATDGSVQLKGNVTFQQGDVTAIDQPDNTYDTVIAERLLINLPEVPMQDTAVSEVARIIAPGGLWVTTEVTFQGHAGVDACRTQFGLPQIEKYWHNLYVDEDHFKEYCASIGLKLRDILRFSTYQFLTKVMHPLIVAPEEPSFMAPYNDACRKVALRYPTYESVQEIGIEKLLNDEVRPAVEAQDPDKLKGFDEVAKKVIAENPDFSMCSHQVLFTFDK